jgi:hypothetical protein
MSSSSTKYDKTPRTATKPMKTTYLGSNIVYNPPPPHDFLLPSRPFLRLMQDSNILYINKSIQSPIHIPKKQLPNKLPPGNPQDIPENIETKKHP